MYIKKYINRKIIENVYNIYCSTILQNQTDCTGVPLLINYLDNIIELGTY